MTGADVLERRYRRLMCWYPAGHRREHEDEMIGVLMSAARSGQRRPGPGESVNLLWGAAQIRLRMALASAADPGWRDSLAIVSVILPLLYLLADAIPPAMIWYRDSGSTGPLLSLAELHGLLSALIFSDPLGRGALVPLILVILVLCRCRRAAALLAAAVVIFYLAYMTVHGYYQYLGPQVILVLCAAALEIAALTASPGPRRGLQLMTSKRWACASAAGTAAGIAAGLDLRFADQFWQELIVGVLVAVITATMALTSPMSRRILVLLAAPVYYYTILNVMPTMGPLRNTLTDTPLAALILLGVLAISRRSLRRPGDMSPPKADGQSGPGSSQSA